MGHVTPVLLFYLLLYILDIDDPLKSDLKGNNSAPWLASTVLHMRKNIAPWLEKTMLHITWVGGEHLAQQLKGCSALGV